ncbi:MAG: monooxygenase [Wenzhouxiangella sp.]|nr:MAG: monooxygenase [Wenzhouxiangella sp.]
MHDPTQVKVAVIGAGPSGLAATRHLLAKGLEPVVFEKAGDLGGNWLFDADTGHASVYENTHIISSRTLSQYDDFPMPENYPDYPGHHQLLDYFRAYADHFGLRRLIRFRHEVLAAQPINDGDWELRWRDEAGEEHTACFTHLVVCNGHHWDPRLPEYPGQFDGPMIHSGDFRRMDDSWRDKRVLIIGAGNSACDVAVEASRVTHDVFLSMRRAQWFVPKFLFGKPVDVLAQKSLWLPAWFRQWLMKRLLLTVQGKHSAYGLPDPEWGPFEAHPTLNQDLLPLIRHGRIQPRPAIERFDGNDVVFVDGQRDTIDIIIAATGFRISFPFFDPELIDYSESLAVPLYRKMLHPAHPRLYFVGLFQPLGCIWPLSDHQARIAAAEIVGEYQRPDNLDQAIAEELAKPHFQFMKSTRHSTEVEYHRFRAELIEELEAGRRRAANQRQAA